MQKSELIIKCATKDDVPRLLDLYQHLIPDDDRADGILAIEVFERFLAYAGSEIFIGEIAGELVASCALVVVPNLTRGAKPFGLIENVVTHSAYRQKGYGNRLLDAASQAAWSSDCYKVMLMTGSKDPKTLRFYLQAGFEQSKTGFQKRRVPVRSES